MKIVYLHQYFCTPEMSGGTRSYEFARRLVADGHDVHVVTSRTSGRTRGWDVEQIDGVTVHWLSNRYDNQMGPARRIWSFLRFSVRSITRVAVLKADLNFATSTPLTIALPAVAVRVLRRTPYVFEVRDLWPELPIAVGFLRNPAAIWLARILERLAYKGAVRIVALSPGMAEGVLAVDGRPDIIEMIPNSCDLAMAEATAEQVDDFRRSREWLQDRPLVVYAGTLGLLNNVEYLVDMAVLARRIDPNIRFLVVGDGARRAAIRERAKACGVLDDNFFLEAPMAKAEVPTLMGAADIACALFAPIAEMENNSSNKFFDALASGTPVLINYGGWHKDLIESHGAGLALSALPSSHDAEALVNLVTNAGLRTGAAGAAKKLSKQFDRDLLYQEFHHALVLAGAEGGVL